MTQDEIKQMVKAQTAQYKAMGMDAATIKMLVAQMETSYQMLYGENNGHAATNMFANTENMDAAISSSQTSNDEEEKCLLSEKHKFLVGCGYILALMNEEDTWTLAAGDADSSETKLSSWWDLHNKQQVLDKIDLLFSEGHRVDFQNDGNSKNIIKQLAQIAKDYKTDAPKEIAAWDYCRIIGLCRWCIDVDYFSEKEAEVIMTKAAKFIQKKYSSWEEMGMAYLLGRAWWAGEENIMEDYGFVNALQAFNTAKYSEDSFWSTVNWKTAL